MGHSASSLHEAIKKENTKTIRKKVKKHSADINQKVIFNMKSVCSFSKYSYVCVVEIYILLTKKIYKRHKLQEQQLQLFFKAQKYQIYVIMLNQNSKRVQECP